MKNQSNKEKVPYYALDVKKRKKDQRTIFHTLSGLLSWPFSEVSDGMSTKHISPLTRKERRKRKKMKRKRRLKVKSRITIRSFIF